MPSFIRLYLYLISSSISRDLNTYLYCVKLQTIDCPSAKVAAVAYNNSNAPSHCGPGNAYFIYIRNVSLPLDFWYFATYRLIIGLNLKVRNGTKIGDGVTNQ